MIGIGIPQQQCPVAENIDQPRDPPGQPVHFTKSSRAEYFARRARGHAEPMLDISRGFLNREGAKAPANRDPLTKLPERIRIELGFEFGLAEQNNLNQFRRGRFKIGKQSNLLERR